MRRKKPRARIARTATVSRAVLLRSIGAPKPKKGGKGDVQTVDANGNTVVTKYTPGGRIKSVTRSKNGKIIDEYIFDPDGGWTQTSFDDKGRPVFISSYDGKGRVQVQRTITWSPNGIIDHEEVGIFERDETGRLIGERWSHEKYSAAGQRIEHTDVEREI